MLYRQATTSELIHSCSFITVSKGGAGDPPVVMSAYDAETAAALWDSRRKKIKSGLTIVDVDPKTREPTQINLYTNSAIIEISRNGNTWDADYKPHKQGRPLMEPMVYRPSLDRPFGKSRVSRAVMSITDSAIRTAVRTEVSSEFFTKPAKGIFWGQIRSSLRKISKWEGVHRKYLRGIEGRGRGYSRVLGNCPRLPCSHTWIHAKIWPPNLPEKQAFRYHRWA
ncbi:hypothetical protein B2M23_11320 [Eubacterium limosum]|uniref:Uncharacterized protein n=1 Tax=Eubacterium limosum TaxID=1736 RepID=A0AAC9QUL9_EUBLI|nr:hypothetical protein B2M23_11320 [Eubacterium limosum]